MKNSQKYSYESFNINLLTYSGEIWLTISILNTVSPVMPSLNAKSLKTATALTAVRIIKIRIMYIQSITYKFNTEFLI